eukprot:gene14354-19251_t
MSKPFKIFSQQQSEVKPTNKTSNNKIQSNVNPPAGRPKSAVLRRPNSSSNQHTNQVPLSARNNKGVKISSAQDYDYYNNVTREDLFSEVQELKKKIRLNDEIYSQLRSENQRLEVDALKQQKKLEQLIALSNDGTKQYVLSNEVKKELEKNMLVRQLKAQITSMRNLSVERDHELEQLKRSLKASYVSELEQEKEEYLIENNRLKAAVKQLKEELEHEKSRREWNNKLAGGTGEELRREVARLANGYQNILSNIAQKNRPSTGVPNNRKNIPDVSNNETNTSKTRRPVSAAPTAPSKQSNNESYLEEEIEVLSVRMANGQIKKVAESPMPNDPLDNFGVPFDSPTPAIHSKTVGMKTATAPNTQLFEVRKAEDKIVSNSSKQQVTVSPRTSGGLDGPSSLNSSINSPRIDFLVGERVEGLRNGEWKSAMVQAFDSIRGTYRLLFDNDAKDVQVMHSDIRMPNRIIVAAKVETPINVHPHAKFKISDKVEALYYNGATWYPATIQNVQLVEMNASGSPQTNHKGNPVFVYDLFYDDGDRELKVSEAKIRLKSPSVSNILESGNKLNEASTNKMVDHTSTTNPVISNETIKTNNSAPLYRKGQDIQGRYEGGTMWYNATITKVLQGNLYDLIYEDGEEVKEVVEEDIRLIPTDSPRGEKAVSPQINKILVAPNSRFQAKEKIDCKFHNSSSWFPATILKSYTNPVDSSLIEYDVIYNDGEMESKVPETNIRAREESYRTGDKVEALSKSGGWSTACIRSVNKGMFTIQYDDGNVDQNITVEKLRHKIESKDPFIATQILVMQTTESINGLNIMDKVECNYRGKGKFYPGKITRVRGDGTYD